jgi:hypothetical protein
MPIPVLSEFGTEADARQQKAEAEEVNEWKSRLENKDAWQLLDIIKKMSKGYDPNKDQLKAVLRILAEKGRINWRQEELWDVLNKLQSVTHLSPNDELLLTSPGLLRQKLHMAFGQIWDYDEYLSLERKNESSYESSKKEQMDSVNKIQRSIGARLEQLYKKVLDEKQVDPQEYEALLEYSIVNGKCYGEAIMFYLIAGIARGILAPDRAMVLDKYLNEFPTMEYVCEKYAPKSQKEALEICKTYFEKDYEKGSVGPKFKNYYWTTMQNSQQVHERVKKSASERKWDHDWSRGNAAMCDGTSMKVFLSGKSGEIVTKSTAMENMYVGKLQWLEENAKNPESREWKKDYARSIAGFFVAEGIRTWVAFRDNQIYQRGENILDNKARERSLTNHTDWTVRENIGKIQNFVGGLDILGGFYKLITDTDAANRADPEKKGKAESHLNTIINYLSSVCPEALEGVSLTTLNDVFLNMDNLVKTMVNKIDDASFLRRIATLRQGIKDDE